MPLLTFLEWEDFLKTRYPDAHLLQTAAWGELKTHFGWKVFRVVSGDAGAQVLFRKLPFGFSLGYLPKGPVGYSWRTLWEELDSICRRQNAICLIVEPDKIDPPDILIINELQGFSSNAVPVQPRRSILVDLNGSEDSWLNRMKQKTRYNIRLAERKGVQIIQSDNISAFYKMMITTGSRDQFGVHSLEYYQQAFQCFAPKGDCTLLLAKYEEKYLAGLMVFINGKRAWYLYGASVNEERNLMPAYLLQWEAMRWSANRGCEIYDLWGVPDCDMDELEKYCTIRSDGLWGVYRFKRGFGGKLLRSVGAWIRVYNQLFYNLYMWYVIHRKGERYG